MALLDQLLLVPFLVCLALSKELTTHNFIPDVKDFKDYNDYKPIKDYKDYKDYKDVKDLKDMDKCSFSASGCMYQVVLKGTNDCMLNDNPLQLVRDEELKMKNEVHHHKEETMPFKKLEGLERKLMKMMEGLSIRSLRHIRQIRTDLREMASTIHGLGESKKKKRALSCPTEFVGVGTWSSCYRFSSFNASWHEAREYCNAFGANLVALDVQKESYIMDYLIKSRPEYEEPTGWWTAGNYIARNRKWMWTSKHHLRPMTFSEWGPGEPNARSTMHCMLLYKHAKYSWHDANCSEKHNFICEIQI